MVLCHLKSATPDPTSNYVLWGCDSEQQLAAHAPGGWRPVVAAAAGSPGDAAREWRSPSPAVPRAPR